MTSSFFSSFPLSFTLCFPRTKYTFSSFLTTPCEGEIDGTVPQSDHSHTARCRKTPVGGNIVERKRSKEYRKGKELIYYYEQTNLADSTNTINCSCYVTSFAAVTLPPLSKQWIALRIVKVCPQRNDRIA